MAVKSICRALTALVVFGSLLPAPALGAISYIGTNTADVVTGNTTATPLINASSTTDDLLLLAAWISGDAAGEGQTTPTGWTLLESHTNNGTGESLTLNIYCKIHDGSEPDPAIVPTGAGSNDVNGGRVFTYRGTDNDCSTIVAHTAETSGSPAAATALPHPALTVSTANTLIFAFGVKMACEACVWDTLTTSGLSWNERWDTNGSGGDDFSAVVDGVIETTATSVASGSWTATSGDESQIYAAILLSIKPAAAGCSGTPSVTSFSSDDVATATENNAIIAGSTFCSTQSTGSVVLRDGSSNDKTLSVDSWSATSIQVDMSGVGMGVANGLKYGALTLRVTNSASNTGTKSVTINPPSGTVKQDLSGGLLPLTFDENDSPSRLFGDPLDLQVSSQVAARNASGCTLSTDLVINADGSLEIDEDCTSFDWDFSRSGLYVGTVNTASMFGCLPTYTLLDFPDLVFQEDLAIQSLDVAQFFVGCDEPITAYSMQVLSSTTDSTTDINGAVNAAEWVVDDASVLLASVGNYVQCGTGGAPVRLRWANPTTNEIGVSESRSCADNASVYTRTVSSTSVPGLTFNTSTGVLSGTPTTSAISGPLVFRAQTASGLNVDTP